MIGKAPSLRHHLLAVTGLLTGLIFVASPAPGQELSVDGDPDRPIIIPERSSDVSFTAVEGIDLMSPRVDGPPALILSVDKEKIRPAPGTYRTRDGRTLRIGEYGQIVELTVEGLEARKFRVARVDELADRAGWDRPRIVLQDARKRTVALPDGRYVNEDGIVMAVSKGTVVGYGLDR